jgi:vitamin B12 transporter
LKKWFTILSLLAFLPAFSQVANTDASVIDSIQVVVFNNQQKLEAFTQTFTKVNPNQSYAQLLQKQSGIFIRTTGMGGLSTPSYKGLGTNNTPITIDGQNMQSSMNGTMDLNLLDAALFSSANFMEQPNYFAGTSNIGTGINLGISRIEPNCEVNISGSSQLGKSGSYKYSNVSEKWKYRIAVSGTQSPNNIPLNRYGETGVQQNNDYWRVSALQTLETSNLNLAKGYWKNTIYVQNAFRQLPQGLFVGNGDATQADRNIMMGNKYYKYLENGLFLMAQNQTWYEQIEFTNSNSDVFNSQVFNVNNVAYLEKDFAKKWKAKLGVGNENAMYSATNLEKNVNWLRFRVFYTVNKVWKKSQFHFKQQATVYHYKPFYNAKLNIDHVWNKKWLSTIALQKSYRLPTLNELYWYEPGFAMGNSDLKPEEGYRAEFFIKRVEKNWSVNVNPFLGYYQNFVLWQGFPEVRPQNIAAVFTRGVEIKTVYTTTISSGNFTVNHNLHWVKATNRDASAAAEGKQLIFTPELTSNLTATYEKGKMGIYVNEQFVSRNYFTSDNSASINPYFLTELGSYIQLKNWRAGLTISNVFNTAYFTMPNMPLPGTVLKININHTFNIKSWLDK